MEGLFLMFMIPFILGGLTPLGIGCLMMFGRCRVEWRDKRLTVIDRAGPIFWRRRLSKGKSYLRKLSVKIGETKVNNQVVTTGPLAGMGTLMAEFDQGKPRMVAVGYPKDWLYALAEDLSARVGTISGGVSAPKVELVNVSKPESGVEMVEKPADSTVRVEQMSNGFTMVVPPAGLWKGSKGLIGFGILWCLFMAVITGFFVKASIQGTNAMPWAGWFFMGALWATGFGIVAGAINMGQRRAMLLFENGQLKVAQQGLFGTKQWEWQRADISAIRADASGMSVNERLVIELQIHPISGKKIGLFTGRNEDELRWMAAELRRAVAVPAQKNGQSR